MESAASRERVLWGIAVAFMTPLARRADVKHLRATARIDPEHAPAFFDLLANSPDVAEARVLEVNTTVDAVETFLIAIDGDASAFAARAGDTQGVESVDVSEVGNERAYAILVLRPLDTPVIEAIHRAGPRSGFVLRTPIVYRDGAMSGRAVGDPAQLQRALDRAPDGMDVRVEEIGEFRGDLDDPRSRLSARQREALEVAHELGYYDQPRAATHADVADEIGCAPQTASAHLQKAEAKLVDATLDEFGPDV